MLSNAVVGRPAGLVLGGLVVALLAAGIVRPAAAVTTRTAIQAEDSEMLDGGFEKLRGGYTGRGYAKLKDQKLAVVEWLVTASAAGPVTLSFRYANAWGIDRPMSVAVNGATIVPSAPFPATGFWTNWRTQTAPANLRAGYNTVRLTVLSPGRGINVDRLDVIGSAAYAGSDWAQAFVRAGMARYPDPAQLFRTGWKYVSGLFLQGARDVALRAGATDIADYVHAWYEGHVTPDGRLVDGATPVLVNKLDNVLPGRLLAAIGQDTGDPRYAAAAAAIHATLTTYPRTLGDIFVHATGVTPSFWLDGTYMVLPFVAEHGEPVGPTLPALDDAAAQLLGYRDYLEDLLGTKAASAAPTGLMYHAYNTGTAKHSGTFWCRGDGWYVMALLAVIEAMPDSHAARPALLDLLRQVMGALATRQDKASGLWYQVLNRGTDLAGNYLETSCSSIMAYAFSRVVEKGWATSAAGWQAIADAAYRGLYGRVRLAPDNGAANPALAGTYLASLSGISPGTVVGADDAYYASLAPKTDDAHGLGLFLLMYEQLNRARRTG